MESIVSSHIPHGSYCCCSSVVLDVWNLFLLSATAQLVPPCSPLLVTIANSHHDNKLAFNKELFKYKVVVFIIKFLFFFASFSLVVVSKKIAQNAFNSHWLWGISISRRAANVLSLSRSRPCSAFELRSRLTDWRTAPHRRIQCVRCARNLWDYRSLSDRCAGVGAVVERVSAAAGSSMRTIVAKFRQSMPFFVLSCWTAAFQSYKGCCCCCCCRWV